MVVESGLGKIELPQSETDPNPNHLKSTRRGMKIVVGDGLGLVKSGLPDPMQDS